MSKRAASGPKRATKQPKLAEDLTNHPCVQFLQSAAVALATEFKDSAS